ncbi:MAG: MaoC family dehydratase N-terminal domain-containing protein [Chloroflexi bacterium]|nr:MaoC family dehydratase N-terminal domain-containing protein [Chloroflexota bacterium]
MAETKLITTLEEFEAERAKGIGVTLPPTGKVADVNLDTISRFVEGIGDYNPLWTNEEYAKKSRFGMVAAPPTFVYSMSIGSGVSGSGNIPGERLSTRYFPINYAGADLEFFRPILLGDKLHLTEKIGEQFRKVSKRMGPILFCRGLTSFFNQRQELVATINVLMARYLNVGRGMEYDRAPKAGATIEPADPLVHERKRRGAQTLYWEDVKEGEEIPTLKKGTYTVSELFQWTINASWHHRSARTALEREESADLSAGGRFDAEHALKRRNMPGQFDVGAQRVCWCAQIVTDWMGNDATLKKMSVSVRHPNIVGDTNTVYGKVLRKYIEDGQHLAEVEMEIHNQAELVTTSGRATVALLSKGTT